MLIGWASNFCRKGFARSLIWDPFLHIARVSGSLLVRSNYFFLELCVFALILAKRLNHEVRIDPGIIPLS